MKPLFNGSKFFPNGICISSYPASLDELDKYLGAGSPPSDAEMADDSEAIKEVEKV